MNGKRTPKPPRKSKTAPGAEGQATLYEAATESNVTAAESESPITDATAEPEAPITDATAEPEAPITDATAEPEAPITDATAEPANQLIFIPEDVPEEPGDDSIERLYPELSTLEKLTMNLPKYQQWEDEWDDISTKDPTIVSFMAILRTLVFELCLAQNVPPTEAMLENFKRWDERATELYGILSKQ